MRRPGSSGELRWTAGLLAGSVALTAMAVEPSLTVVAGGRTAIYTTGGLLALPTATTLAVPADPLYGSSKALRGVPFSALLSGAAADNTVRFLAGDRELATLPAGPLLAQGTGAVAYVAIEPADAPWPPLKAGTAASAGPFRLIWLRADKATAGAVELWPAQITRIEEIEPLGKRYPMIMPASRLAANHPIRAGFAAFQKHCMSCHMLNGGGDSTVGPDLNIPYSPTEYLRPEALRRLIRDPQSLRRWPASKMPAFDAKTLSDRELAELLAYLRHMADRKVAVPAR
jgi:mono/diheme cytochrome c family protein